MKEATPTRKLPITMKKAPPPVVSASKASPKASRTSPRKSTAEKAPAKVPAAKVKPPTAKHKLLGALKTLFPQKSQALLANDGIAQWSDGSAGRARTIETQAKELEMFLNAQSGGNSSTASEILKSSLNRNSMQAVRSKFQSSELEERCKIDASIARGAYGFCNHHKSKGTRPKSIQDAMDAVLVAACFDDDEDTVPPLNIAKHFDTTTDIIEAYRAWAETIRHSGNLFAPKVRKTREDCILEDARRAIHEFCHSDEGSRLDTNSYRVYKLPWLDKGGEVGSHQQKIWHEKYMTNHYKDFAKSNAYAKFRRQQQENGQRDTISETVFRNNVCKCVRDPSPESCVDLLMSGLSEYMKAITKAVTRNKVTANRLRYCNCDRHTRARDTSEFDDSDDVMWEDLVRGRPNDLIRATCCKSVEQPMLYCEEVGTGRIPKLIPWACTHGTVEGGNQCTICGVDKILKVKECPALSNCDIPIPVMEWTLAPRAGTKKSGTDKGKQNTQIELTPRSVPMKLVVFHFLNQLKKCRSHYNEKEWLNLTRTIDIASFSKDEIVILTDFSATCDLRAAQTDNSSQDAHAVLAIFAVLHSRREVKGKDEKDIVVTRMVNDCDVWHFFGETISKGKKNDHVFHNVCLEEIVQHYKRKTPTLNHALVWTDNCAGQYKCSSNFLKIASFSERVGDVRISHRFAQKYHFKGVWDAAGKIVKDHMRDKELAGVRFSKAVECFKNLRHELKTPKKVTDILKRNTFTVTTRFFGFGTESKKEFNELRNEYAHIVFTNRKHVPKMKKVDGTQKLFSVKGTNESCNIDDGETEWKLRIAHKPCACRECRGKEEGACPFQQLRNEKEIWVSENKTEVQARPRNADHAAIFKQLEPDLRRILEIHTGNITCKMIVPRLRLRNLAVTGRKHELAQRLAG